MAKMLLFLTLLLALTPQAHSVRVDINQNIAVDIFETETQVTHYVSVGSGGNPIFSPNRLNANVGDQIRFVFQSRNHTLTESSLEDPCSPIDEFDTGSIKFSLTDIEETVFTITVTSLEPRWFFCKQDYPYSHCHAGMVFALNPGDRMRSFLDTARRGTVSHVPTSSGMNYLPSSVLGLGNTGQILSSNRLPSTLASTSFSFGSVSGHLNSLSSATISDRVPVPSSHILPVLVITVTETAACSETQSTMSVRRANYTVDSSAEAHSYVGITSAAFTFALSVVLWIL